MSTFVLQLLTTNDFSLAAAALHLAHILLTQGKEAYTDTFLREVRLLPLF